MRWRRDWPQAQGDLCEEGELLRRPARPQLVGEKEEMEEEEMDTTAAIKTKASKNVSFLDAAKNVSSLDAAGRKRELSAPLVKRRRPPCRLS